MRAIPGKPALGVVVVFFLSTLFITPADAVQLFIESPTDVEVGQVFPVDVSVDTASDLYGTALDVVYNSDLLAVTDADLEAEGMQPGVLEGTLLSEEGIYETILRSALANETQGRLVLGNVRAGQVAGVDLAAKKILLTIYYEALAEGTATISSDPLMSVLKDGDLNEITIDSFLDSQVIISGFAPEIPHSPDPEDNATSISVKHALAWVSDDPDAGDTVLYDVYFGTQTDPLLEQSGLAIARYDPGLLNYSMTYYWKVKAADTHGATKTGPVWRFTTFSADGDEDDDGLTNQDEVETHDTDPHDDDTDDDGMPDGWEVLYGLEPTDETDADGNPDEDAYTNLKEYQNGTDPTVKDILIEKGDINNDETVDLADAILALQTAAGVDTSGNDITLEADVDGNQQIGLPEAIYVLQKLVELR